jgi:ATP-binding cassette subfamily B protein
MFASLRKLLAMVKKPGRYSAGLIIIGIVAASINIFFGLALMLFVNAAEAADLTLLVNSMIFLLTAMATLMVLMPLGYWLVETSVAHSTANLRCQFFRRALRLTASWLERRHSGDLTSRGTTDIQTAEQAYATDVVNLVEILLGGLGCMAAMVYVDWKLALVIVLIGLVRVAINTLLAKPLEKAATQVQKTLGTVTERISDIANGGHVIRMYNYQKPIREKFRAQNELAVRHGMNRVKYAALANSFGSFSGWMSFLGMATAGSWLVLQGWYSIGTIMLFLQLQNGVNGLFGALGHFITQLQTSLAGSRRVLEVIQADQEPLVIPTAPARREGAISLEGVTFAYTPDEEPVLENIDLSVAPGETVALVGPSGSGKSTLFKLLLGFYAPREGGISLLGKGMNQYTLEELREQIAYVPQLPYLFSGTIAENIGYGKPGATQAEIEAAARAAYAHEFISQLPQGYETLVGERGSHLSGGERQRIAIARAILRDAPILLLDEATSSLDTESEEQVQLALKQLMQNRTTLVIAHRLSTIRDAHRIVVIHRGRIAEEGDHQELLEAGGIYRRLHDMQFQEDLENAG